jgi:hypothetical protein
LSLTAVLTVDKSSRGRGPSIGTRLPIAREDFLSSYEDKKAVPEILITHLDGGNRHRPRCAGQPKQRQRKTRTALRLEGEINGRWVEELRKECVRTLGTGTMTADGSCWTSAQ